MAKFDLKDGFWHLPVAREDVDLLGFQHPQSGRYLRWLYLPFGVMPAPAIFQWVAECIRSALRRRGLRAVIVYIDDWLIVADSADELREAMRIFVEFVGPEGLGWGINGRKTLGPAQALGSPWTACAP